MISDLNKMRLLFDQNAPQAVADIFAARGHIIEYSRDVLQQSSPDHLIAIVAALEGLVVVTKDKDYKRYSELFPQGFRSEARRLTGRFIIGIEEAKAAARVADLIDLIEAHYINAARRGVRLQLNISATGITVIDHVRPP